MYLLVGWNSAKIGIISWWLRDEWGQIYSDGDLDLEPILKCSFTGSPLFLSL